MSNASGGVGSIPLQDEIRKQQSAFSFAAAGVADVREAIKRINLALIFGWQDIAQRYRRSKIGVFWLTINMGVMICAIGLLFSMLLRSNVKEFLPSLSTGIVLYGYISTFLNESCTTFIVYSGIILQVRMPLSTHLLRTGYRNAVVFFHNLVILPIVLIAVGKGFSWTMLLAIPGFVFVSLNILWMGLILAVLCTRFRDLTQIVANILQVMFYMTPIMWLPATLPAHASNMILYANPFYHMIELVRAPVLGQLPPLMSWGVVGAMTVVGWGVAILIFGRFRHRVPYWL